MAGYCIVGGSFDGTKTSEAACDGAGGTWVSLDSSQESTIQFGGDDLGKAVGWSWTAGQAVTADITSADSTVVGSGDTARVVRELDCVGIEPGRFQVRLFGCPPYTVAEIGSKATLSVVFSGGSLSAEAILDSFDVEASAGELLRGQASFILTGT